MSASEPPVVPNCYRDFAISRDLFHLLPPPRDPRPMTAMPALLFCSRPQSAVWNLPKTGQDRRCLIGWRTLIEQDNDAGVPAAVAALLARALTAVSTVTFFSSATPAFPAGMATTWAVSADGRLGRIGAKLTKTPSPLVLVSTRSPEVAATMFDVPAFPWWMQAQRALLTHPDAGVPTLNWPATARLLEGDSSPAETALGDTLLGTLAPGVDGDVAVLTTSTDAVEAAVLERLTLEARRAGFEWTPLSEAAFAEGLSRD